MPEPVKVKTPQWLEQAECVGLDPELFYSPDRPGPKNYAAKAFYACRLCPVRGECRDAAIREKDEHSYRGGMTPEERLRWKERNARVA